MVKTTLYLPRRLKAEVSRAARVEGLSEAVLMRQGIESRVEKAPRPRLRGGIFASDELIGSRVDEMLEGFGEQ